MYFYAHLFQTLDTKQVLTHFTMTHFLILLVDQFSGVDSFDSSFRTAFRNTA